MSSILGKGVIRNGRVEIAEPIDLPDGTEVIVTGQAPVRSEDSRESDRPMSPDEIAQTLAAMAKIEPFDMTEEERAAADAWEKKIHDYTIANLDKDIEEMFR